MTPIRYRFLALACAAGLTTPCLVSAAPIAITDGPEVLAIRDGKKRVDHHLLPPGTPMTIGVEGPMSVAFSMREFWKGRSAGTPADAVVKLVRDGTHLLTGNIEAANARGKKGRAAGHKVGRKTVMHMDVPEGAHTYVLTLEGTGSYAVALRKIPKSQPSNAFGAETLISTDDAVASGGAGGADVDNSGEATAATDSQNVADSTGDGADATSGTVTAGSDTAVASTGDGGDVDGAKDLESPKSVIPADAGIQDNASNSVLLDPRVRGDDVGHDSAPPTERLTLAVSDVQIEGEGFDPVVSESISTVLAAELKMRGGDRYTVITRNELKAVFVQQAQAQALGCSTPECAADLGKLAAANHIVTATVAKLGEGTVMNITLVDVASGNVLSRQSVNWRGDPSGLVELVRPYVARLLDGTAAETYTGSAQLVSTEEGAVIHINDKSVGETPLATITDLPIGAHSVQVSKEGYLTYATDIVVNRNETTLLQVRLIDEDTLKPWYMNKWAWVGTATTVVGAVAAFVLLRNEETTLNIRSNLP